MNTKPLIHVRYENDDGVVRLDKYLYAAVGHVFHKVNLDDTLDVVSLTEDTVILRLNGHEKQLHPGESVALHYELPGLIADGSGFEYYKATVRWLTEEETAGVSAEHMNKAVGMRLRRPDGTEKGDESRLFGVPCLTDDVKSKLQELCDGGADPRPICQIDLWQLAKECKSPYLPTRGYLYFFLEVHGDKVSSPVVYYTPYAPNVTKESEAYGLVPLQEPLIIEFFETEQSADGCKLLGECAGGGDGRSLLLQIDPLDDGIEFLSHRDGFLYFLMGDDLEEFTDVALGENLS